MYLKIQNLSDDLMCTINEIPHEILKIDFMKKEITLQRDDIELVFNLSYDKCQFHIKTEYDLMKNYIKIIKGE